MSDLLDWKNLGFSYIKTDYRFIAHWKDGKWDEGKLTTDNMLHIHEGSTAIHYGQQCFEGLKAYRCKDGSINLFRPQENAKRMQHTSDRLLMPQVPTELFIRACKEVVKANQEWLGPYGSGATLYLRPFLFGTGANIGVKTAPEFIFSVFCCPVGAYFKGGLAPSNFITTDYDRAAPMGTGGVKVGGNYAASLLPHVLAAEQGTPERKFADAIYLDPKTHTKIEEEKLPTISELDVLARSEEVGTLIAATKDLRKIFVTGHIEYDADTLHNEYVRDKNSNLSIEVPVNYYPGNDDTKAPKNRWRGVAYLFYHNWLNQVYQQTPYDLTELGK